MTKRTNGSRPVEKKPVRMTPAAYERARLTLMAQDPRLGALIARVGKCRLRVRRDGDLFSALCETITSQQLSTRVADVIYGRLCAACAPEPHPTPERILALDTAALRAAGLSGPKAAYVHALAERVGHGDLSLEALDTMPDDAVNLAMMSLVTASELPGWLDQKVIFLAGSTPVKSGPVTSSGESPSSPTDGPPQAARASAEAPAPASPSRARRPSTGGWVRVMRILSYTRAGRRWSP